MDNSGYAQQSYGGSSRGSRSQQAAQGGYQGGMAQQGYGSNMSEQEFRQRFASNMPGGGQMGQPPMQQMHMMQMEPGGPGGMGMMHQGQHMTGYRGHGDMGRNSPGMSAMVASQPYMGMPDVSPNMAAQRMQMSAAYGQTPTSPAAYAEGAMQGPPGGIPPGSGGPPTQADREEELLLNLLIARRQRGRVSDPKDGSRNPSLAEELMRMRQQNRSGSGGPPGRSTGLPPVPGMPPLGFDQGMPSVSILSVVFGQRSCVAGRLRCQEMYYSGHRNEPALNFSSHFPLSRRKGSTAPLDGWLTPGARRCSRASPGGASSGRTTITTPVPAVRTI